MSKKKKEEIKKEYPLCFASSGSGSEVTFVESWTSNKNANQRCTETLGYVPLEKQVKRLIEAGENLVVTRLKEGTFSNDEGDEEFHDNPLDDISRLSYDELVNLQKQTSENFYIKKAAISKLIKDKKSEKEFSTFEEGKEGIKPQAIKPTLSDE